MHGTDWDRFASGYSGQLYLERRAVDKLLDLLDVGSDERLLDVATGPAVVLDQLARRELRPEEAVGIDASREMLRRAPELPLGWVLQEGDARRLPFADGTFDVVSASYLLHVLDAADRRAVVAEVARVLRPGGRVGTLTVAPPLSAPARALTAPLRRAAERSEGKLRGLSPLDPTADLAAGSLVETARARTFVGYPSLCLVAQLESSPTRA